MGTSLLCSAPAVRTRAREPFFDHPLLRERVRVRADSYLRHFCTIRDFTLCASWPVKDWLRGSARLRTPSHGLKSIFLLPSFCPSSDAFLCRSMLDLLGSPHVTTRSGTPAEFQSVISWSSVLQSSQGQASLGKPTQAKPIRGGSSEACSLFPRERVRVKARPGELNLVSYFGPRVPCGFAFLR